MPSTIDTKEQFPAGTTKAQVETEMKLRLKAGAINSKYTGSESEGWVLTTTWNVIGEQ
jgi:hypothetical protein